MPKKTIYLPQDYTIDELIRANAMKTPEEIEQVIKALDNHPWTNNDSKLLKEIVKTFLLNMLGEEALSLHRRGLPETPKNIPVGMGKRQFIIVDEPEPEPLEVLSSGIDDASIPVNG